MPIILKPGNLKKTYEIVSELSRGAFANAYEAKTRTGERVFFKQYKSPTPKVDWYSGFVSYQKEIKNRIEADPATKDRCYRFIEFFEENDFYQVFEFIDGGRSLTNCLNDYTSFTWSQWVVFAKVMMFGIKALHEVKIVHSDLKPDNLILIPDATIGMGYKLRIIDLDWALLSDKQAPWHGKQGYVGTPSYMSPEHIQGKTPSHASDIFTCGIILSEILSGGHPYKDHSDEIYNEAALKGEFTPIKLKQSIDKLENPLFLESVLNACLDPEPSNRPTAAQVCDALMGKTFECRFFDASKSVETKVEDKALPPESLPTDSSRHSGLVSIFFDGNKTYSIGHDAELGKQNFKNIHSDAQFLSNPQFKIFKKSSGVWAIEHISSATNETIVNGKKLDGCIDIVDGMTVAVGNSAKGIHKLPLTLKLT